MGREVVHRHSPLRTLEEPVRDLGYALEGAISRLEVEVRGPVVGEVLAEAARST